MDGVRGVHDDLGLLVPVCRSPCPFQASKFWNGHAEAKCRFFAWMALHGKILTADNLRRIHPITSHPDCQFSTSLRKQIFTWNHSLKTWTGKRTGEGLGLQFTGWTAGSSGSLAGFFKSEHKANNSICSTRICK